MNTLNLKEEICYLKIVGLITNQGYWVGHSKRGENYKTWFFTVSTKSAGVYRNIPCVLWNCQETQIFKIGTKVEIVGDLTFIFSKKVQHCEMKVRVINFESL